MQALFDHIHLKNPPSALRALAHALVAQQGDQPSSDVLPLLVPDGVPITRYKGRNVVIPQGFTEANFHALLEGEGFDGTVDLPRHDDVDEDEIEMPQPYTPVDGAFPHRWGGGRAALRGIRASSRGPFLQAAAGIPPSLVAYFYRDLPHHPALVNNRFRHPTFDGEAIEGENSDPTYRPYWIRDASITNRIRDIRALEDDQLREEDARLHLAEVEQFDQLHDPERREEAHQLLAEAAVARETARREESRRVAADLSRVVLATELNDLDAAEESWNRVFHQVLSLQARLTEREEERRAIAESVCVLPEHRPAARN
ncbi:hypothetical protein C8R43DRAFT_959926 [Mycena crocata]|nr:hypothetical protein C8R43DRAFT_959926 [Mycena crocata]